MNLTVAKAVVYEKTSTELNGITRVMVGTGLVLVAIAVVAPVMKMLAIVFLYLVLPLAIGGFGTLALIKAGQSVRRWLLRSSEMREVTCIASGNRG